MDWAALGIPDYPEVITQPMDLSTVQMRFESGQYTSLKDIASDVDLIWENGKAYNPPGAKRMQQLN